MTNPAHEPLTISIRDLGPIAYAALELRPLTVLVGPSGAGKTFAAASIFGLANAGHELASAVDGSSGLLGYNEHLQQLLTQLSDQEGSDWYGRLREGATPSDIDGDRLGGFYRSAAEVSGRQLATAAWSLVGAILATPDPKDLTRSGASLGAGITLGLQRSTAGQVTVGTSIPGELLQLNGRHASLVDNTWIPTWQSRILMPASEAETGRLDRLTAAALMVRQFAHVFLDRFGDRPLYLPSGRTGLLASAPIVALALARGTGTVPLRGSTAQFMPALLEAGAAADGVMAELATSIDQLLHGGKIEAISSPSPLPELRYVQGNVSVPLERASSSVSELAAVTYFIRKLARKNSLIVLEEPEAHLHPAKQLLLARALARMIHAGLRVVVTTHSDVLVDALGWLLRCNELDDQFRTDLPEQERLNVDQVGVYRFRHDADLGGYTADPVVYDPDDGFDRREFLDISADLFNRHADLSEARAKSGGQ